MCVPQSDFRVRPCYKGTLTQLYVRPAERFACASVRPDERDAELVALGEREEAACVAQQDQP